jgi:hypothetical protein
MVMYSLKFEPRCNQAPRPAAGGDIGLEIAVSNQHNFQRMTLGGRCGDAKHDAYALGATGFDGVELRLGGEVGDKRSISGDAPNVHGVRKGRVSQ